MSEACLETGFSEGTCKIVLIHLFNAVYIVNSFVGLIGIVLLLKARTCFRVGPEPSGFGEGTYKIVLIISLIMLYVLSIVVLDLLESCYPRLLLSEACLETGFGEGTCKIALIYCVSCQ